MRIHVIHLSWCESLCLSSIHSCIQTQNISFISVSCTTELLYPPALCFCMSPASLVFPFFAVPFTEPSGQQGVPDINPPSPRTHIKSGLHVLQDFHHLTKSNVAGIHSASLIWTVWQRHCYETWCRKSLKSGTYLLTYLLAHSLHGEGYYLKSWQSLSLSKNPAFFMEPEGSLPCSQKPTMWPYPEPAETSSPLNEGHIANI